MSPLVIVKIAKLRADGLLEVPRCPVCPKMKSAMQSALEHKFERELKHTGIIHSLVNLGEICPNV
jgi:hypothetical protein